MQKLIAHLCVPVCNITAAKDKFVLALDEKLDLHIQQMWCKYKANATFDHVCSNLLLSVGPTLPHFYTQSKAGKCHICHTFATVSKSTDNMFFFTTFGCVAILMPNEAFCKYFARSFKFDLKLYFCISFLCEQN